MAGNATLRGDGSPFDLPGKPGGDAALLLHGLTGSPFEVRPVADRLHAAGVRCLGPLLPGHEAPLALAATSWRDWLEGARQGLASLGEGRRTIVVGSSMGALLACALAAESPGRVDGVALLAPALELTPPGRFAAWLARRTPLASLWRLVPKRGGSDVADPEMRAANPCMDSVPLRSVGELADLEEHVERLLPRIRCPALVVAGANDRTVTLEGARRLTRSLGERARLVVLPRSQHLVAIDRDRERCVSEVASFFDSLPVRGTRARQPVR